MDTVWLQEGDRLFHVEVGSEVEAKLRAEGYQEVPDPNAPAHGRPDADRPAARKAT